MTSTITGSSPSCRRLLSLALSPIYGQGQLQKSHSAAVSPDAPGKDHMRKGRHYGLTGWSSAQPIRLLWPWPRMELKHGPAWLVWRLSEASWKMCSMRAWDAAPHPHPQHQHLCLHHREQAHLLSRASPSNTFCGHWKVQSAATEPGLVRQLKHLSWA